MNPHNLFPMYFFYSFIIIAFKAQHQNEHKHSWPAGISTRVNEIEILMLNPSSTSTASMIQQSFNSRRVSFQHKSFDVKNINGLCQSQLWPLHRGSLSYQEISNRNEINSVMNALEQSKLAWLNDLLSSPVRLRNSVLLVFIIVQHCLALFQDPGLYKTVQGSWLG